MSAEIMSYRSLSYWFDSLGAEPAPRPALPGDLEVDVAIVGGGFTGLWTAYYLAIADPSLRVAVLERETAGFGASGRNGGWCMAIIHGLTSYVARDPERGGALRDAVKATTDEIERVCVAEQIEADFYRNGGITLATNPAQASRLQDSLKAQLTAGMTEADYRWLEPAEVTQIMRVASNFGGTFMGNVALLNPAKLARGLADAAERRGAVIYEQTPVLAVEPGLVRTARGEVRAARIVLALDAYVTQIPGRERHALPAYNHMIATEPLPSEVWERIGLRNHEGFGDAQRLLTYAQRTADDRIAIGGRELGYRYGSRIDARFERSEHVERWLVEALRQYFPDLGDFAVTHRWGGVLGMPRDFHVSLGFDEATGIAVGPNYAGDGVCASNLAGRTLCDLLRDHKSELVELPWVHHRSPRWEPEPLRWLGVRLGGALNTSADRAEIRTGRRSPLRERVMRGLGLEFGY
jgi:glycine/D-amino acid oxidase-like deaminating enzyme